MLAPSIVSELIARNAPVIVCAVGSNDSRIEVENGLKTLKSYESIAKLRKAPVAMIYRENSSAPTRKDVDMELQQMISTISALFSRQNKEMDTADLHNWLYYTKVTSFEPKLVKLEIFEDKIEEIKNGMVISVATLALDGTNPSTGSIVEYQCVGYVNPNDNRGTTIKSKLHYVLLDGIITEIYKSLSTAISKLDESKNSRIAKGSILSKEDTPTTNGLVF